MTSRNNTTHGLHINGIIQNGTGPQVTWTDSKKLQDESKQKIFRDLCRKTLIVTDLGK